MEKKRILVVDDDQVARMLILKVLTMRGYHAIAAENGMEALDNLEHHPWDAMILDLELPDIQGLNILEQALEEKPDLKIVILTAHGTLDSAIKALRFHVVDYLLKPVIPGDILRSMDKAFSDENLLSGEDKPGKAEISNVIKKPQIISITKNITYDYNRRKIEDGSHITYLTSTENNIFKCLLEKKNQVVTHIELVEFAHNYQVDGKDAVKILRPVICRLRLKLAKINGADSWLQNVRGSGYLLEIGSAK
jgi:DNA-binding response OmpR family regulator